MPSKLIYIERMDGAFQRDHDRVIRVVPDGDRRDDRLRRAVAFRLKADGEAAVSDFLVRNLQDFVRYRHPGRFYDFLTGPLRPPFTRVRNDFDPPGAA